ncbi:MAG: hypothetical protein ABUT20_37090, partial [Bacteroidota bacterium]
IRLCIIDDGKGFDPENQKHTHGLTSIREIAASINAELSIQSSIGKGTKICITAGKKASIKSVSNKLLAEH